MAIDQILCSSKQGCKQKQKSVISNKVQKNKSIAILAPGTLSIYLQELFISG